MGEDSRGFFNMPNPTQSTIAILSILAIHLQVTQIHLQGQTISCPVQIVLRPGQNYQFAGTCPSTHTCDWRLATGHDPTSSITATGYYTAPATMERHGFVGGCALLPHNSIYNVRLDFASSGLTPVSDNANRITQIKNTSSVFRGLHGTPNGLPLNQLTNSSPLAAFVGDRPAARMWDGNWRFESPAIAPPGIQSR